MATASGTLTALNTAVAFVADPGGSGGVVAGSVSGVGVNIAGTFSLTVAFEATEDGQTWFAVSAYPVLASGICGAPGLTTTTTGEYIVPSYGFEQVRARCSAYTSGTATIVMDGSGSTPFGLTYANTEGLKPSYSAALSAGAVAASANDIAILNGSSTKTIRITHVMVAGTIATAAAYGSIRLIVRSTADGAVNTSFTAVPHDSNDAAATAAGGMFTANPTLGTAVGTIASQRYFAPLTGTPALVEPAIFEFGFRPARCPVLRGTAQGLAVNLSGFGANASTWDVKYEWTEE